MTTTTETMTILKTGTCASVSGKSKLTYEIGLDPARELHLRISKNSGTGYFSDTWVLWEKTWQLLEKTGGKPISSHSLSGLYKGQSVNTAGFLLAALLQEGVVRRREDTPRYYQLMDPKPFLTQLQGLYKAAGQATPKTSAKSSPKAAAQERAKKTPAKKAAPKQK